MATTIQDGSGFCYSAKVDSNLRLHTHAVTETAQEEAGSNGDSYNVNTGTINLTSSNETSVLYFTNTSANPIHTANIGFLIGNSTSGSGDMFLSVDKQPTAGTLITNAVDVDILQNKNVTSPKVIAVTSYKGVEGDTCTGGVPLYNSLLAGSARNYVISTGNITIEPGGSICVKVTPQVGNTSMNLQVFMSIIEYNLN